jgi:hypothetical protein
LLGVARLFGFTLGLLLFRFTLRRLLILLLLLLLSVGLLGLLLLSVGLLSIRLLGVGLLSIGLLLLGFGAGLLLLLVARLLLLLVAWSLLLLVGCLALRVGLTLLRAALRAFLTGGAFGGLSLSGLLSLCERRCEGNAEAERKGTLQKDSCHQKFLPVMRPFQAS